MFQGKGIFHFTNILIDFLMIISMNSAIREDNLLGTLFLFGISYLGGFIGRKNCGSCGISCHSNYKLMEDLNDMGLALSMLMLTCCMVVALGVVEFHIVRNGNFFPLGSVILLQSAEGAYLTFGAVNVTGIIMIYMAYPLVIHALLWVAGIMDQNNIEISRLVAFWIKKWYIALVFIVTSALIGGGFCKGKYQLKLSKSSDIATGIEGEPQYWKYAVCFAIIGFGMFLYVYGKRFVRESENSSQM